MNDGNVREQALEENTGNNEDDDVIPDLPVLSVIIKEEDGVLEYNVSVVGFDNFYKMYFFIVKHNYTFIYLLF